MTVLYHGTAASGETEESVAVANALAAIDQESTPTARSCSACTARHRRRRRRRRLRSTSALAERDVTGALHRALRQHPRPAAGQHARRPHDAGRPRGRPRAATITATPARREGVNEMETRHRLSLLRLLILVLVVSGLGFFGLDTGQRGLPADHRDPVLDVVRTVRRRHADARVPLRGSESSAPR